MYWHWLYLCACYYCIYPHVRSTPQDRSIQREFRYSGQGQPATWPWPGSAGTGQERHPGCSGTWTPQKCSAGQQIPKKGMHIESIKWVFMVSIKGLQCRRTVGQEENTLIKAHLILCPVIPDLIIQSEFWSCVWLHPFHHPVAVFLPHFYLLRGLGTNCATREFVISPITSYLI